MFNPPSGFYLEGAWLLLTEPMFEFSRSGRRQVEFDTHTHTERQVDKALNAKLVEQSGPKPLENHA